MEILSDIKSIYANTDQKIIVTDDKLSILWSSFCIDIITLNGLLLDVNSNAVFPPLNNSSPSHIIISGQAFSTIITQLNDSGSDKYMFQLLSVADILPLHGTHTASIRENYEGNLRLELYGIISDFDNTDKSDIDALAQLENSIRLHILKAIGSIENASELSKFRCGDFHEDYLNISAYLLPFIQKTEQIVRSNGYDFNYRITPNLFLNCSGERLKACIANLIANGFSHNKADKKSVDFSLYESDEFIVIEVTDNGGGADIHLLNCARQPYGSYREHSVNESLGISLCELFAKRAGGQLSFSNENLGLKVQIKFKISDMKIPDEFRLTPMVPYSSTYDPEFAILSKCMTVL